MGDPPTKPLRRLHPWSPNWAKSFNSYLAKKNHNSLLFIALAEMHGKSDQDIQCENDASSGNIHGYPMGPFDRISLCGP